MRTSKQGIALIKEMEGFRSAPYLCSGGKPTIGYGHVIQPGERFSKRGISQLEAEIILKQDVSIAEQAVSRLVTTPLVQNEFDALVSFVFNIGFQAFEKSTLLMFLNNGDKARAAHELPRWVYAGGVRLTGLVNRRNREYRLFSKTS